MLVRLTTPECFPHFIELQNIIMKVPEQSVPNRQGERKREEVEANSQCRQWERARSRTEWVCWWGSGRSPSTGSVWESQTRRFPVSSSRRMPLSPSAATAVCQWVTSITITITIAITITITMAAQQHCAARKLDLAISNDSVIVSPRMEVVKRTHI